ncbi:MAG: hypothetical protein KY476_06315, partial [Planctomycetes bacterium]|nr:hypothetical protein [Planctomycetota bacterium]
AGRAARDRARRPLAREHVAAAGKPGGQLADRWNDVLQVLSRARRRAEAVRQQYGLSPAETAVLEDVLAGLDEEAERKAKPAVSAPEPKDRKSTP